ncbi:MAG: arginine kinase [Rhodospirillaceae bacterium]|nr:MAG: arginine kinase [Rhodospirillaceae bacterium]
MTDSVRGRSADGFPEFPEGCRSLLKTYLTLDVWNELKDRKTRNGVGLYDCIRSGIENTDSKIGVYAGDAESYAVFAALFAPVIAECHPGYREGGQQPSDMDAKHFRPGNPDPDGNSIVSVRIRVARNICGYRLRPTATGNEDLEVEQRVKSAAALFSGDLAGTYRPVGDWGASPSHLPDAEDHIFERGDRFQEAAGLNRNWPGGRGVFANKARSFFAWVNEEDQLRLISIQRNADIAAAFARLCEAVETVERVLEFQRSDTYGYLSSCPTNLGTGLRASFHMRLPLSGGSQEFQNVCMQQRLAVRSIFGEQSAMSGNIYDISNKRRLGLSEVECLHEILEGAMKLIDLEKSFAARTTTRAHLN